MIFRGVITILLLCLMAPVAALADTPLYEELNEELNEELGKELDKEWDKELARVKQRRLQLYTPREVEVAEGLFARLFAGDAEAAQGAAAQLGLSLRSLDIPLPDDSAQNQMLSMWLLSADQRGGGQGIYLIPRQPGGPLHAVQVPHRRSDRLTETLALQWLQTGLPVTLAFNSVGRKQFDLAHEPDTLFVAFARAYAAAFPQGRVLQLHGFSVDKRKTEQGRSAEIILSAGSRWPGRLIQEQWACLQALEAGAKLYPWHVAELGGTRNSSGQALRAIGFEGFSHLEMSRQFRQRWHDDPALGREVWRCIN